MQSMFCYHCGGELADGAIPFIFPTDISAAPSRPDEMCRCSEIVHQWPCQLSVGKPRFTEDPRAPLFSACGVNRRVH